MGLACLLLFVGLLTLALVGASSSNLNLTPTAVPVSSQVNSLANFSPARQINALVADPTDYQNLFAATDKGVLASSDGGKTWEDATLNATNITTLALDGSDPERPLYAGTLASGLYKSSDGGKTWNNLGLTGRDIVNVAAYQGHVYVGVRGTFSNIYASNDAGKTFTTANSGQLPPRLDVRTISIDPVNPNQVYIGTAYVNGLHFADFGRVKFSGDGGKTWKDLGQWQQVAAANTNPAAAATTPHLDPMGAVTVLQAISSSRIYAGNGQTLFLLSPNQNTWQPVTEGLPQTGVLDVTSDPQVPTVLYASTNDGFYRNTDGQKWVKISEGTQKSPVLTAAKTALSEPALIAANTHNNAISVNNLNSTYLYALATDGDLSSYENRDFGNGKLAPLPGGPPLPDFSAYGGENPADPLAPPATANDPNRMFFKETGHYLAGGFLTYWKQNGSLDTFGFPLTEEFSEFDTGHNITLTVQYFERAKFEYHAEFPPNQRVQLALIGDQAVEGKYYVPGRFIPTINGKQDYFKATGHTLQGEFYQFWTKNGGLGRFGQPVTEQVNETQADGHKMVVQYFERAKLEYEPDKNGKPGPIQIGLIGRQVLIQKGWLKSS